MIGCRIWERLVEMAACHRKTIIITTHYIEEARQAHTVSTYPLQQITLVHIHIIGLNGLICQWRFSPDLEFGTPGHVLAETFISLLLVFI